MSTEIKDYHLPHKERDIISEEGLVDEFIKTREDVAIRYFILDLVTADYNVDILAKYAIQKEQANALGYVCDVVKNSLPKDLGNIRKRVSSLSDKLYSSENHGWEHLSLGLPDWAKKLMKRYSTNSLNSKWHVYTNLNEEEVKDWFRVYNDDLHSPQNASRRILV